jgi:class 3 adenylate cyclase
VLDHSRAATIGRAQRADMCLAWDQSVSSVHAEAIPLGDYWLISDEGISRNGTFINNERLSGRRRLRHGDVIRVGRTLLAFRDPSDERPDTTTITDVGDATGTATLLFTDLVGSTELMDRLGDEASDRLRREHFAMLTQAASEHGGRVVKSLGDGLMLTFDSASGALACAVAMQRRVAAHGRASDGQSVGLRVGVNAGEVISAGGDFFGTPVVVAKRLCDRAGSGQALVSDVVRTLVGTRGEYRFTALGPVQLKGFADPIEAFELDWRGSGSG